MKTRYEYLCFGLLGEYFGTVYTLKEARAHADRVKGIYYYRRQERLDDPRAGELPMDGSDSHEYGEC